MMMMMPHPPHLRLYRPSHREYMNGFRSRIRSSLEFYSASAHQDVDIHRRDFALDRDAAIVRERDLGILDLALACAPLKLERKLVDLRESRGADRVPLPEQAA